MIKENGMEEKQDVYDLWRFCYPTQNEEYLKFYFEHLYDTGISITQEQDNHVVSSLQMNYHTLSFHGRYLKCSYLLGASTLPDYRRRGHMRTLMNSLLDEAEHNCLITFIRAFHPKMYDSFGFEVIYTRKAYTIAREELIKMTTSHVFTQVQAKELVDVYQRFTMRFDGFYVRDVAYYELLLSELRLKQKELLVYRDNHGTVNGYIIYQMKKNEVLVQEAVYLNSTVLKRLLKKAIGNHTEITVMVSACECLEKIFPLAIPKKQPYMMARINNYELFNKLYNTKVKQVQDAFKLLKKPLWLHEYY